MRRPVLPQPVVVACAVLAALVLLPQVSRAQFGGGGGAGGGMRPMTPGGMGGPGQGPPEKDSETSAEAAPETLGQEAALQPLPAYTGENEKKLQFFQLGGYLRGRSYLFHQFDLGVGQLTGTGVQPAFHVPYSEYPQNGMINPASCDGREGGGCKTTNLTSADMRLRLEPIINVTDQVRVKAQIDVFDNLTMGSTNEGYFINGLGSSRDTPLATFSRSQTSPTAGVNGFTNSIHVKRAWAEVRTPIGELRFGRMPSHWGTGMFVNDGNCLDCDFGTNVDRIMFATKAFNHFLVLAWDWVATGPTTALFYPNQRSGVQYNADPLDDVSQWAIALGRQDKSEEIKERVERGDVVLNYGGYFVYRRQSWDLTTNPGVGQGNGGFSSSGTTAATLAGGLTPRDAWAFIPDLWLRLHWKKLTVEAEGVMIYGKINRLDDQSATFAQGGLTIRQFGAVGKVGYKLLHDAFHLGLEVGFASGDSAEDPNGVLNVRNAMPIHSGAATNFTFDPDYHIDLILFRRIIGAVTNATYFKPHAQYDILDNLSARVDLIYSLASNPVGWPGNSVNLGVELDGTVWYHNDKEGFSAGLSYGVLFPLDGLSYPPSIYAPGWTQLSTAQTVQGRVAVKF